GGRPDYYIERIGRDEVRDGDTLIWHEPGYVLDAKYYKPRDSARAPASPVKRMIADLALTGERHGALLFAFQNREQEANVSADLADVEIDTEHEIFAQPLYDVQPEQRWPGAASGAQITIWKLQPYGTDQSGPIGPVLRALLDEVHITVQRRVPITCQGFLPDVDTVNPLGMAPARCQNCGSVLAFCPKPHLHAPHVDRVCPRCDCLRSARLCHIIDRGSFAMPPFVKRVLTQDDLIASIGTLRSWLQQHIRPDDESERAEQARQIMLRTIGELTESYVKLTRADTMQTEHYFRNMFFRGYWSDEQHERGLPKPVRDMLVSGEFVYLQFQMSSIEDWAACAVQFTRALEYEIHRRLYEPSGQRLIGKGNRPMQPRDFTFGSAYYLYKNRAQNTNWSTTLERVARPSNIDEQSLITLLEEIDTLRSARNKVAHTHKVDAALAEQIRDVVLGGHGRPGLLYRLCKSLNPPQANS
ncbi:hypothetical protein SE17_10360, partial [Kouleothrix aurantiaca]